MVILLSVLGLGAMIWAAVSVLGILYPFRPFRTRKAALRSLGGSIVLTVAAALIVGSNSTPSAKVTAEAEAEAARAAATVPEPTANPASSCILGDGAPGDVVAVTGDHEMHEAPDAAAARIKNEKASAALGETHYHQIDASTTVRRLCQIGDWTEVQIVTPDWLTSVRGWVPSSALRGIETSAEGARVFVEADFYWDDDTAKAKDQIVAVVNKIARENDNCPDPDPSSVAKSADKSKPGNPVFYVTCGSGADVFNIWFRPGDATDGTTFDAVRLLSKAAASEACEQVAKSAAAHPSTVDFSRVMDLSYFAHKNGNVRVTSSFTAKNAFDLELKYDIYCFFEGNRLVEQSITEAMD